MANENQYYKYPFADNGNYDDVPDQASGGVVDYESGYGPDYEKAVGVEGRKRIERTSFNGIVKGITKNIKQSQEYNWPTWIEDDGSSDPAVPFSYDAGIVVYHDGQAWVSLLDSNSDKPSSVSAKWRLYKTNSGIEVDGDGGSLTQTLVELQSLIDSITGGESIGVNQTRNDVTGFRSKDVSYTNTSGRPIMLTVSAFFASNQSMELTVGGISRQFGSRGSNTACYDSVTALVLSGEVYEISGNGSIVLVEEIR